MDLVQILSHDRPESSGQLSGSKVQGHALTIKDEFIPLLIEICSAVTDSFLSIMEQKTVFWAADTKEKLFVAEEDILVKAIDTNLIKNWDDFEFSLALIIENRVL